MWPAFGDRMSKPASPQQYFNQKFLMHYPLLAHPDISAWSIIVDVI